ncbi:hypothetical protein [Demequina lutea]|uniref:Uncharacterized protein n=1 Tax=Demequina lutea TaxID=431489 RepID=A0A7Z0CGR1_9MICO|nr:hypothetical protein [Demequina lutea]NYI40696.1 hypothetical protein [Demequina lutea]
MTRRRPAHRLTSALIGAIVAAVGVLTIALLSGRELDTELIAIIALAAVGGWLLITALISGRRPRSGEWAAQDDSSVYAGGFSSTPPGVETGAAPLTAAARSAASKAKRGGADAPS